VKKIRDFIFIYLGEEQFSLEGNIVHYSEVCPRCLKNNEDPSEDAVEPSEKSVIEGGERDKKKRERNIVQIIIGILSFTVCEIKISSDIFISRYKNNNEKHTNIIMMIMMMMMI
jgi:hypothetical protein